MAKGTVHHVPVTRAESGQNELPEIFSLPGLGIVLHPHVVGVELMARNVREQLGEIQPPQELHGVVSRREPRQAHADSPLLRVRPARQHASGQQVLSVALRVNGVLQKLSQMSRAARPGEGLGREGEAGWR